MKVFYKNRWLNALQETDYNDLENKPLINSVELQGDHTTEDIEITWFGTQAEYDALGVYNNRTLYIIEDGEPVGEQVDYNDLKNIPSINGLTIESDHVSDYFSMYTAPEVDNMIASLRAIYAVAALPASPTANTIYYVGPNADGVYHVYLYDAVTNQIDLGLSKMASYKEGSGISINSILNKISAAYDDKTVKVSSNELWAPGLDTAKGNTGSKLIYTDGTGAIDESTETVGTGVWPVKLENGEFKKVDSVFPIGSSIIADNDPGSYIGGTWTRQTQSNYIIINNVKICWGQVTINASSGSYVGGPVTITFPGPAYASPPSWRGLPSDRGNVANEKVCYQSISNTSISIYTTSNDTAVAWSATIPWFAIGTINSDVNKIYTRTA